MRVAVLHAPGDVRVEQWPEPTIVPGGDPAQARLRRC